MDAERDREQEPISRGEMAEETLQDNAISEIALLTSRHCCESFVVYHIKCECGQSYIGRTERELHYRHAEHFKSKSSSVFQHQQECKRRMNTTILGKADDVTRLCILESLYIKKLAPTLNKREELLYASTLIV